METSETSLNGGWSAREREREREGERQREGEREKVKEKMTNLALEDIVKVNLDEDDSVEAPVGSHVSIV